MRNSEKMTQALKEISQKYKNEITEMLSSSNTMTVESLVDTMMRMSELTMRIDSILINSLISEDDCLDLTSLITYQSVKSILRQVVEDSEKLLNIALTNQNITEEDARKYLNKMTEKGIEHMKKYYS